ncbi:1-phosphatidylinositol-4-phosphate 5-kinase [Aureococcus anophagefferens]|uniref:1-phosphatidylinositol-4-phosphate 5-kinase n=1 Tax=Aureococcus anophagefferens TaxID=44056 RepID=A0ABR1FZ88_AURAN
MARVRAAYGVNLEAYCRAWKTISKKARFTAGASGALFLFSDDERFIAKTATLSEIQTLARMAPDLAAYVEGEAHGGACSRSRLGRLLGAHTLYLYGRRLHVLVQENLFYDDDPAKRQDAATMRKYDVKGSWARRASYGRLSHESFDTSSISASRRASFKPPLEGSTPSSSSAAGSSLRGSAARSPAAAARRRASARGRLFTSAPPADLVDVECPFGNFGHKPNVDGKDNDLEEKLQLPDAQARELVQQLDRDTKFLASRGIMDYSLLVGITMQEYHVKTYARRESCQLAEDGADVRHSDGASAAPPSVDEPRAGDSLASKACTVPARIAQGPATYTLGIIDMLQEWDLGKRAEACCKVRCKCQSRRGISAVAPSEYQERFMDHVENIIAEDAGQPRLTNLADRPTLV